jgi:hypothetical protein
MGVPWWSLIVGASFIVAWSLFWKVVLDVIWSLFGEEIIRAQLDFEEWTQ